MYMAIVNIEHTKPSTFDDSLRSVAGDGRRDHDG